MGRYRCRRVGKNAMAVKETTSNEETCGGTKQVDLELPHALCLLQWTWLMKHATNLDLRTSKYHTRLTTRLIEAPNSHHRAEEFPPFLFKPSGLAPSQSARHTAQQD